MRHDRTSQQTPSSIEAFPRKRFVNQCTSRFRRNAGRTRREINDNRAQSTDATNNSILRMNQGIKDICFFYSVSIYNASCGHLAEPFGVSLDHSWG